MKLCDKSHGEVCYEGDICPVCELRDNYAKEIDAINEELDVMQAKLDAEERRG